MADFSIVSTSYPSRSQILFWAASLAMSVISVCDLSIFNAFVIGIISMLISIALPYSSRSITRAATLLFCCILALYLIALRTASNSVARIVNSVASSFR